MWRKLVTQPLLSLSIFLAVMVWLGESLLHYLVFNHGHPFEIIPHDFNEIWMRVVMCVLIIAFGSYAQKQTHKKIAVEREKLRTLKATMHTVEDSVGNALVGMKYILSDALNNQRITEETESNLIQLIDDTISQLREISNLDVVHEKRFSKNTYCLDTTKGDTQGKE
ncbi:MAG: hypothetical protein ABFS45_01575 [Pseudomonadota bacterium]